MRFLPYERLKIHTALSHRQVLDRLAEVVEPKRIRFLVFNMGHKAYQGEIKDNRFEISRIIGYRNSFLPQITGEVHRTSQGSVVHLTMMPHVLILGFMALWLGAAGLFFAGALVSFFSTLLQTGQTEFARLLPGGFLVFGYALLMGGFKFESVRSKNFFRKLWEATEVEELGFNEPFEGVGE